MLADTVTARRELLAEDRATPAGSDHPSRAIRRSATACEKWRDPHRHGCAYAAVGVHTGRLCCSLLFGRVLVHLRLAGVADPDHSRSRREKRLLDFTCGFYQQPDILQMLDEGSVIAYRAGRVFRWWCWVCTRAHATTAKTKSGNSRRTDMSQSLRVQNAV